MPGRRQPPRCIHISRALRFRFPAALRRMSRFDVSLLTLASMSQRSARPALVAPRCRAISGTSRRGRVFPRLRRPTAPRMVDTWALECGAMGRTQATTMMRLVIACTGSVGAEAVLDDLSRAGLPRDAEARVLAIGGSLVTPGGWAAESMSEAGMRRERIFGTKAHARATRVREEARQAPPTRRWSDRGFVLGSAGTARRGRQGSAGPRGRP